ncbi:hypothetical protein L218DRAFT_1026219, partial [Marasmius fiardii PR-910]
EKPTIQQSWDAIMRKVNNFDNDLLGAHKEDIDTLLVFAGLFSAVVTAFTIESYQWLQEDPADTTVLLLMQIVQQGSGQSPPPSPPQTFTPLPTYVRINTFWFLSLTLSLIVALFGLLCKQWLRTHQRQTNTQTSGQALALCWLRHQSLEHWHVHKILSLLPIFLELALFLFFAGLLELLWNHHPIPFAIVLVAVGLAVVFYLITTILPGLNIIQHALKVYPTFAVYGTTLYPETVPFLSPITLICPYRSPQSWLAFRLLSSMFYLPGYQHLLHLFLVRFIQYWKQDSHRDALDQIITRDIHALPNWPSLDLHIIQGFSRIKQCPDFYELKGLQWLVEQTQNIPSMIPHLRNVLGELPLHLVMPAIFNKWD